MIEVENLTKKYGDLLAVHNLSFTVKKGHIWGLLGPNAAGKTTTMRILTGYLPATEGKASVAGYDVFEQPNDVKKIMGYLPENVPLYPEMTVHSFLNFVAEIKQIPSLQRKEAVEKAIKTSSLESVRGRLIKNISRGFKQRVGIAQALIHDPQVLILDEPTIGLDPAQIIEIRQLIKSLKGERTVILSTHILAEVTQTCDGVVIINEGKLMASGSLEEIAASLQDKEGIFIRLRDGGKEKVEHFQNIPGVDKVTLQDDGYNIEWERGKDKRDDITRYIVERSWSLVEMRPLAMNIEDLYLKVVSGGRQQ
ncbi:MAG: ABC transporter ATP-binding protein [Candidatus Aminicenantes bacterium]|nr:ABC transporter ATP-binding protein [Candidatus Aminicenantes bacterium]MDH5384603.1 ABC transporter ATP-binding protein [Candidatus Aminicenantes bacterium]MDH5743765.1 ABC transporter ATP-binding protein [Candidatus Aminicenantes bacterium]